MSQFNVTKEKEGDLLVIKISGSVDEDADFSGVDFEGASKIAFDLDQVGSINSCGIREWIKWIKGAPAGSAIVYRKCPKVIVDQINMVAGFLPENGTVESFYVPYYSEDSGNEKMLLFTSGKEFKGSDVFPPEEVKDDSGEVMEMDVIEAKYFKFLKG